MNEIDRSELCTRFIALLAAAISGCWYALEAPFNFNMWDEGFLWYGVRQVMAGEVPIRDFQSYDVGRYYLSAAMMAVQWDDGIAALRGSLGVIQSFGVGLATYLVLADDRRPRFSYGFLAAILFTAWMLPRYKTIDMTICITVIAALAFALRKVAPRRWFVAGVVIGLAAIGGRNHGVYGLFAATGAVVYAYWGGKWRDMWRTVVAGSFGVVIGYSPNLVALATVSGYAGAFWDSIVFLLVEYSGLPLPVPWPWVVFGSAAPFAEPFRYALIGSFFIALPLFGVCGAIYAKYLRRRGLAREPAVFVAASLLAMPYAHYAYTRADLEHLALGVFPLLIGLLTLPLVLDRTRFAVAGTLLIASLIATIPVHPAYIAAREENWRDVSVGGDSLTVNADTARDIALLEELAGRYTCNGRTFLATPYWPGAYPALHRKSPIWEIYALVPRSAAFQEAEIARIRAADPGFAVIFDFPLDGREELRYARTHPMIEQFIRDHFRPIERQGTPAWLRLYARDSRVEKCP